MIEVMLGTLLVVVIQLTILLLFREPICWFLKTNVILKRLHEIEVKLLDEEIEDDQWCIRTPNKWRPMKVNEQRLSTDEMKEEIKNTNVDLRHALLCPPGESQFRTFNSSEEVLMEIEKKRNRVKGSD
jgi:hypothetical protein